MKLHLNTYIIFPVKPHIDRTNLEASTIRKGRSLKLDVNVKGEPAPKVTWYLNNQVINSDFILIVIIHFLLIT